jgi:hypothetical protein
VSYSQALEEQVALTRRIEASTAWRDGGIAEGTVLTTLQEGDPYFWAESLCGVIQTAAGDLPLSWKFAREMLPTMSGFIWLQRPIAWPSHLDHRTASSRLMALGWQRFHNSDTNDTAVLVVPFTDWGGGKPWPALTVAINQGQSLQERLDGSHGAFSDDDFALCEWALRVFGSCMTFLEQRIFVTSQQRAERHTRKRLERQGYDHEPLIRVVELRRKQAKSEQHGESEPIEWSCQWVVSGHWRNQWYPSLNANQPRWIMPYVKGPEDAPLKPPRAKVFAVVR